LGCPKTGYWIVAQIESDLEKVGLITNPPFTAGWIDNTITLVPVTGEPSNEANLSPSDRSDATETPEGQLADVALRVESVPSANLGVESVSHSDSLEKAQSVMLQNDYSQLAVMSGARDIRGAISWESIAQAKIRNPDAPLREAILPVEVVRASDVLLAKIPRIMDAGFVFVQALNNRISELLRRPILVNSSLR
jgi:hypothetical protein